MILRSSLAAGLVLLALPANSWSADAPAAPTPSAIARPGAAALPGPLDGLAGQVAGVVGSGDKLGLMLKEGEASRTLHLGDTYQDGWVLTGLTAEIATLSKAEQSRQVGLNPGNVVAQRDLAPASQITTVGAPKVDPAMIDALMQRLNASGMNIPGMDAAATQQILTQARSYMATPAGQAQVAQAYQNAVTQYGQGAIDQFMARGSLVGAQPGPAPAASSPNPDRAARAPTGSGSQASPGR